MRSDYFFAALVLVFALLILSGCALFPQGSSEIADVCAGRVKSVQATDNFTWRFLGFSTQSTRRAECGE